MELTQELVRELLHYDPETGVFTWKERVETNKYIKAWNTRYAGTEAGKIFSGARTGYKRVRISVEGTRFLAHRLAWLYMTGEWPKDQIDHKNGDATDNKWCNMILSSSAENNRNSAMRRNNISGHTGICRNKDDKKWRTRLVFDHKEISLGCFENIEDAVEALNKKREELGFTARHGQEKAWYVKEPS